jgi:hypothetical protein
MTGDDRVSLGFSTIHQTFARRFPTPFLNSVLTPKAISFWVGFRISFDSNQTENLAPMFASGLSLMDGATELARNGVEEEVIAFLVGSGSETGRAPGNDFGANAASLFKTCEVEV